MQAWGFGRFRRQGQARVVEGVRQGATVRVVEPLTFMNRSGEALHPFRARADFDSSQNLLVLVDEVALPLGTFRFRKTGSAGGHNGLRSVEGSLRSRDYCRLRIGVGPVPDGYPDLADYVLERFLRAEREVLDALLPTMTDAVDCWLADGIDQTMNRFNR